MHDFYYFLYLGRLFIHLNIIIQASQHSSIFFLYLSTTMLTSAFNQLPCLRWEIKSLGFFIQETESLLILAPTHSIIHNALRWKIIWAGYRFWDAEWMSAITNAIFVGWSVLCALKIEWSFLHCLARCFIIGSLHFWFSPIYASGLSLPKLWIKANG